MTQIDDYLNSRKRNTLSDVRFEPSPIIEGIVDVCNHDDRFNLSLIEQFFKKCEHPEPLTDDEWERIYPLDSYFMVNGFYSWPQLRKLVSLSTDIDVQAWLSLIEKQRVIHAPIIVHHTDVDVWFVASGKARLVLCAYLGIRPEVIKLRVDYELNNDGTWRK